jgi:hypothetical protein
MRPLREGCNRHLIGACGEPVATVSRADDYPSDNHTPVQRLFEVAVR